MSTPLARTAGKRLTLRVLAACACLAAVAASSACGPSNVGRPAVSLRFERTAETPRDAAVLIDEEYVGPLGYVAARGVRLPIGEHRITVQKPGYFSWDKLVEADREAIFLKVELTPIPD
jgi:hypothetical protein